MNTKLLTINKLANPQKDTVNEKIFKLSPNKTYVLLPLVMHPPFILQCTNN